MKKITLMLLLVFPAVCFTSQAQPKLGISPSGIFVSPDSLSFYQPVSYAFKVVNQGDSVFNGNIYFSYSINNVEQGALDSTNSFVELPPNDSLQFYSTGHVVEPPKYEVGDNIVVIWPIAEGQAYPIGDSGIAHLYVDTILGIGDPVLKEKIHAFYDSHSNKITLNYGGLQTQIEEVTCYDVAGRREMTFDYAVNEIKLTHSSTQLMLLAITTKQGETLTFKILRLQ